MTLKSLIIDLCLARWPCGRGVVTVEYVFSHMWARLASEDTIMRFLSLWDIVQRCLTGNAHVQQHRFLSRWTWDHRLRYVYQTPLSAAFQHCLDSVSLVNAVFWKQEWWHFNLYLCAICLMLSRWATGGRTCHVFDRSGDLCRVPASPQCMLGYGPGLWQEEKKNILIFKNVLRKLKQIMTAWNSFDKCRRYAYPHVHTHTHTHITLDLLGQNII